MSYLEAEEPPKAGTKQNDKNRFTQGTDKYEEKLEDGGRIKDNPASSAPPTVRLESTPHEDNYEQGSKHPIHYRLGWLSVIAVDHFKLNLKEDHMYTNTNQILFYNARKVTPKCEFEVRIIIHQVKIQLT